MRNIRRFQRTVLVAFTGMNTFVFTTMKNYSLSDRIWLTVGFMLLASCVVLLAAYIAKVQREKKKGFNNPQSI